MKRNVKPRHERNMKSLEQLQGSYVLKQLTGSNGNVTCAVDDVYHNWLVSVSKYAFDAVSNNGITTVEEVRKYVSEHPRP